MNDINFFSSFVKLKEGQAKKSRLIWGAVLGVILVVGLFYGFLGFRILYLTNGIQTGNDYLNSSEVNTKLSQIRANKVATSSLKKYDIEIVKVLQKVASTDKVSSEFLDTLQKAFPSSVRLKDLSLKETQLTLQGTAPIWTTTAELTHNLEASGLFSRVQVNSISQNEDAGTYLFDILCDLKEVAAQ
ncbi:MAG TPA: PilN domain-containing protein [Desulfosporosinus sp.]|nr:PilN domain-containing protein [Desulfosporosinus sp.]